MASLTKIMTCYVVCETVKRLKIDPETIYAQVSRMASTMVGTSACLRWGDYLTFWDLLHGLMLPSGNDAAWTLAEAVGIILYCESIDRLHEVSLDVITIDDYDVARPENYFIMEMNRYAILMGLEDTVYVNPHGLSNKFNRSSAHDLAKLCFFCMKNEMFERIVGTRVYGCRVMQRDMRPKEMIWENTNKMLDKGYKGVKTGITYEAGPCLASCLAKGGKQVFLVLLCSESVERRWYETEKLINWCIKNFDLTRK
eukprot:TRINITY_DN5525_c0_g1_i4.p1 TRINITY_DN5525_c0_g1~~TRINITY_DN5525_c0_g1_i4.p1  ORF type:complete len:255 (+),score=20.56 TRINITY_DN5525_c0_g1_i4:855-1619(+)